LVQPYECASLFRSASSFSFLTKRKLRRLTLPPPSQSGTDRARFGVDRIAIIDDQTTNVYMRGAGKAFAFRCNPYDYRSAANKANGNPDAPPLVTVVRDETLVKERSTGCPKNHGSEGWRFYGTYEYAGTVVPTGEEFCRLPEEKKEDVINRFMDELKAPFYEKYWKLMFDGVLLGDTPLWDTRFDPSIDEEVQRAAVIHALETTGLNIAFNIFRYIGPVETSPSVRALHPHVNEVDECVRNRAHGRSVGHRKANSERAARSVLSFPLLSFSPPPALTLCPKRANEVEKKRKAEVAKQKLMAKEAKKEEQRKIKEAKKAAREEKAAAARKAKGVGKQNEGAKKSLVTKTSKTAPKRKTRQQQP
jgi:hypothetical protein